MNTSTVDGFTFYSYRLPVVILLKRNDDSWRVLFTTLPHINGYRYCRTLKQMADIDEYHTNLLV